MIKFLTIDPIANLLGDWSYEINAWSVLFKIALTIILAAIIGTERSNKRHAAGLRTFIVVSLASTIAMLLDLFIKELAGSSLFLCSAATVIAIAIVSANTTVFSSRSQIKGLTTSVALWSTALIGLTIGASFYVASLIGLVGLMISLSFFPTLETYLKNRSNHFEVHLELKNSKFLQDFVTTIRELGLQIDDIELNPAYTNSGLSVYSISITIFSKELKKYKTHKEIIDALKSLEYVYHIEEMN